MTQAPAEIVYHAHGGICELWRNPSPEMLVEGPAGTGKSRGALEYLVWCADNWPKSRHLVARQTRVSLTESLLVTLENKVLIPDHVRAAAVTRANRHSYQFKNGSEIIVGGLDNPDRIMSTEFDTILVAEATEAGEDAWEKLLTRLRNNVMPFQQAIAECNPGPSGHWLNRRANAGKMQRIKTYHRDNPSLTPEYLSNLSSLSGYRRQRLFEGLWVSAEGVVYVEFAPAHICQPFPIPESWPRWRAIDYGGSAPTACLWFAIAPNETVYVYREYYQRGGSIGTHAAAILTMSEGEKYVATLMDPHAIDPPPEYYGTAETIAVQYAKAGIESTGWPYVNVMGEHAMVQRVKTRLENMRLKVFSSCIDTINEFQTWSYALDKSGQPAAKDAFENGNNHALDTIKGYIGTNPCFTQSGGIAIAPRPDILPRSQTDE